jgi:hypothetical protein
MFAAVNVKTSLTGFVLADLSTKSSGKAWKR